MSGLTRGLPGLYFLLAFAFTESLARYPGENILAVAGRVCWQTAGCIVVWYAPHAWRWMRRRAHDAPANMR